MIGRADFWAAALAALALHAALAVAFQDAGGSEGPGAVGAVPGVALASTDLATLAETWSAPPSPRTALAAPKSPVVSLDAPVAEAPPTAPPTPVPTAALAPAAPAAPAPDALAMDTHPDPPPRSRATRSASLRAPARETPPPPPAAETDSAGDGAAGDGAAGDGAAGDGSDAARPAVRAERNSALQASALRRWGAAISRAIERSKRYPRASRRRREEGAATVRLRIAADGRLVEAAIARSSGHARLDEAALTAVRLAAPFAPAPRTLDGPSRQFTIRIDFKLR